MRLTKSSVKGISTTTSSPARCCSPFTSWSGKLTEHPDYPSLLSVSDVLTGWKIENVSVRANEDLLKELPTPFIAQLKAGKESYFTIVRDVTNGQLEILDVNSKSWKAVTKEEFGNLWTGTTTLVSPEDDAGEISYNESCKCLSNPIIFSNFRKNRVSPGEKHSRQVLTFLRR